MRTITSDEVMEAMGASVSRVGADYVIPGQCLYVDPCTEPDCDPVCLIGHALDRLGLDLSVFYNECSNNGARVEYVLEFDPWPSVQFTKSALMAMTAAQDVQDHKMPWGLALATAVKVVDDVDRHGCESTLRIQPIINRAVTWGIRDYDEQLTD